MKVGVPGEAKVHEYRVGPTPSSLREGVAHGHAVLVEAQAGAGIVGGSAEAARPTTHAEPTGAVDGVVHDCVANMPGAVPRTSTCALNDAALPFALAPAGRRWRAAPSGDAHLKAGPSVAAVTVTCEEVAPALELPYTPADAVVR